jgi:hypothetical protein
MSRRNTMQEDRYRVQVHEGSGESRRVTRESSFRKEDGARDYYSAIFLAGAYKALQVRRAGRTRFETIEEKVMWNPEPLMTECPECNGDGEVPATCEVCNKTLTEKSVEPGTDDLCKRCAKKENES